MMRKSSGAASPRLVVFLISMAHGLNHLCALGLIPFLYPLMIADLGLSYTEIGVAQSGFQLTSSFLQIASATLAGFMSTGMLLGLYGIVFAVGVAVTGSITGFPHLFASRQIQALGSSAIHPVGVTAIADVTKRDKLGRSMGIFHSAAGIGGSLGPIVAAPLVVFFGWRSLFVLFALPVLAVGFMIMAFLGNTGTGSVKSRQETRHPLLRIAEVIKDRNLTLMIVAVALSRVYGLGVFFPTFFIFGLGFDIPTAGLLYAVFLTATILGPMLFGYISDKIGRKSVLVGTLMLASLMIYLMIVVKDNIWLFAANLIALGLVSSATMPVMESTITEMTHPSRRSVAMGLYFTTGQGFGAVWNLIIGALFDLIGFIATFIWMAFIAFIGSLILLGVTTRVSSYTGGSFNQGTSS